MDGRLTALMCDGLGTIVLEGYSYDAALAKLEEARKNNDAWVNFSLSPSPVAVRLDLVLGVGMAVAKPSGGEQLAAAGRAMGKRGR